MPYYSAEYSDSTRHIPTWNINWKFGPAAFPLNGMLISSIISLDFCRGISVLDRFVVVFKIK